MYKKKADMMWLISVIQFWFKIIFNNKNTSDHKNHMKSNGSTATLEKMLGNSLVFRWF